MKDLIALIIAAILAITSTGCDIPSETTLTAVNLSDNVIPSGTVTEVSAEKMAENNIAATEFVFASHKSIKITISSCISEKTRKDLYASEVTERAHNALHKNHRFNCNITTVVS